MRARRPKRAPAPQLEDTPEAAPSDVPVRVGNRVRLRNIRFYKPNYPWVGADLVFKVILIDRNNGFAVLQVEGMSLAAIVSDLVVVVGGAS